MGVLVRIVSPAAIRAQIPPVARERQLVATPAGLFRAPFGCWALAFAIGVQVPVDRGAGNAEEICDLLDGALAGVVELPRVGRPARR